MNKPKLSLSLGLASRPNSLGSTTGRPPSLRPSPLCASSPLAPSLSTLPAAHPPPPATDGDKQSDSRENVISNFTKYVDASGKLSFKGKAVLHSHGVDFSTGNSYKINLTELHIREEIGRGQFGVVNKVFHEPTQILMAMKQIRLDITDSAFRQILMELEVLHRSASPFIVEFYGAFFLESCVYYCMEFMDAGSLDRLYGKGLSQPVLAHVAWNVVQGLNFLKEHLNVIHRDVKPTNILINTNGEIKLCDFGVSGQLVQSMAKTNIGCQTYMAPERIAIYQDTSTYTVAADIWSLGLTLWEAAMGHHPFSTDQYDSVFAQLNAIVNETVAQLDPSRFTPECQNFIDQCLRKDPGMRANYAHLLKHSFISVLPTVDMKQWVQSAIPHHI